MLAPQIALETLKVCLLFTGLPAQRAMLVAPTSMCPLTYELLFGALLGLYPFPFMAPPRRDQCLGWSYSATKEAHFLRTTLLCPRTELWPHKGPQCWFATAKLNYMPCFSTNVNSSFGGGNEINGQGLCNVCWNNYYQIMAGNHPNKCSTSTHVRQEDVWTPLALRNLPTTSRV